MIAAQLLAYYFTELKDDQVKKVSALCFFRFHVWTLSFSEWVIERRKKSRDVTSEERRACGVEVIEFYSLRHHQNSGVVHVKASVSCGVKFLSEEVTKSSSSFKESTTTVFLYLFPDHWGCCCCCCFLIRISPAQWYVTNSTGVVLRSNVCNQTRHTDM